MVVTINYRLGIFGFFNLNSPEAAGNQGLKDQVMALKWVKKHVKNFGGDPNRITIFGQSAGGFAVGLHMISPNTKGLFRRAILQSGSPVVFDQFYQNTVNIAKRLVQYVDCDEKPKESNENPLADSSTEANTAEEENEDESGEEESGDDAKIEDKVVPGAGPALNAEMKSNLNEALRRRKRADDEGDDDDGEEEEDDEKKNESTTTQSSSTSEASSSSSSASSSSSSASSSTSSSTTTSELPSTPSSSTVDSAPSSSTGKPDDEDEGEDNEEDNENEAKSSSTHSTEISSSSSVSSTTESSSTAKSMDRTYFTTPSVSSTSASPSLTSKKSGSTAGTGRSTGDQKKADKILKCMQSKTMKTLIKAQKNAMQNSMWVSDDWRFLCWMKKIPC